MLLETLTPLIKLPSIHGHVLEYFEKCHKKKIY